jgi:small nuclear ribonucleoprotein (snRNP)-like protein
MSEKENKYLDKLLKVVSKDGRIVLGRLKCLDYLGNLYLNETVEVFNKESDHYFHWDLYKNTEENLFTFETEKNQYQTNSPCLVPWNQVEKIYIVDN